MNRQFKVLWVRLISLLQINEFHCPSHLLLLLIPYDKWWLFAVVLATADDVNDDDDDEDDDDDIDDDYDEDDGNAEFNLREIFLQRK